MGPCLYLSIQKAEAGTLLFCSQPVVCNELKVNLSCLLVDLVSKKKKKKSPKPKKINLKDWDRPGGIEARAESRVDLSEGS